MWFSPRKRATMPATTAAYYTTSSTSSPSSSHSGSSSSSSSTRPSFIVPLPTDLGSFSVSQLRSLTANIELRFPHTFDIYGTLDCVLKDVRWLHENVGDLKGAFYMCFVVLNALPRTREVIAFMRAPGTTQGHRIRFQNYLVQFQVLVDHLEAQIIHRDRNPSRKMTR